MASIHETRVHEDHKAIVTEMISPNYSQDFEAYTDATMKNRVLGDLTLINSYNYSGHPIGLYPSPIESNHNQGFIHKAVRITDPVGSMGCVVYSGNAKEECAWLLAWHTPIGGSDCKVYVECGRVAPYKPMVLDWDVIKQKLGKSSTTSTFKDINTGVQASAEIEFVDGTANLASIFNASN